MNKFTTVSNAETINASNLVIRLSNLYKIGGSRHWKSTHQGRAHEDE